MLLITHFQLGRTQIKDNNEGNNLFQWRTRKPAIQFTFDT